MNVQTILVPYDFSEYADRALEWAVGLAEKWNANVLLFHTILHSS